MSNKAEFKELIKDNFITLLRRSGFKGSEFSYRKITNNHYIHALSIQDNKYDDSCCIEMGVFIDFIPNSLGNVILSSKVTPYDCDFKKRLLPKGTADYWWKYGENKQEAIDSIKNMVETYQDIGINFFKQFNDFPEPLNSITLEEIVSNDPKLESLGVPLNLRLSMTLARLHMFLKNYAEAIKFCNWGLININEATALKPVFEEIRKEISCNL